MYMYVYTHIIESLKKQKNECTVSTGLRIFFFFFFFSSTDSTPDHLLMSAFNSGTETLCIQAST